MHKPIYVYILQIGEIEMLKKIIPAKRPRPSHLGGSAILLKGSPLRMRQNAVSMAQKHVSKIVMVDFHDDAAVFPLIPGDF